MGLWKRIKAWLGLGKNEGDTKLVSFVLLLAKPVKLNSSLLTKVVSKAWKLELSDDNKDATEFVVGEDPMYITQTRHGIFSINNFGRRYFDGEPTAEISDLRLRRAVDQHVAWMSVDRMGDEPTEDEAYPLIGKLITALGRSVKTPPLVYWPDGQMGLTFNDEVATALCSDDPRQAFIQAVGPVPVMGADGDDPRMKKAIAEAKRRWPEFIQRFENRQASEKFAVKTGFGKKSAKEYMWVEVTGIENGMIFGKLSNEPMGKYGIKFGDLVRKPETAVIDWLISDDTEMIGAFTNKAIEAMQQSQPKKK
jgi:uncharacterized protein YegJ (DUF2314 family)